MQNKQSVFVTGGTGFAGTYSLFYLLKNGYKVAALKRESSDTTTGKKLFEWLNKRDGLQIDYSDVEWRLGDMLDPTSLIEATKGYDIIVNTAASVSFQAKERDLILKNNIDGTSNTVTACIENKIKRLIHLSSVAALPNPDKKEKLDESFLNSTFFEFATTYGESKYRSEMEVWKGMGEGLDVTVFNPGVILGAWKITDSSVQMFKSVLKGLPFYSSGLSGFVSADDVAQGIVSAIENEKSVGERFILVGANWSFKDLIFSIADNLGKKRPGIKVGLKLSEVVAVFAEFFASITGGKAFITKELAQSANRRTYFQAEKVQDSLDLKFRDLEGTIKETANFMKAHPELV